MAKRELSPTWIRGEKTNPQAANDFSSSPGALEWILNKIAPARQSISWFRPGLISNTSSWLAKNRTYHNKRLSPGGKWFLKFTWGSETKSIMKMNPMQSQSSKYEQFILISEISAALWVHIIAFETTLRKFIHDSLSDAYKSSTWWLIDKLLTPQDAKDFYYAEKRLINQKRKVTPILIVYNMSLSFWVELLSRRYHEKIWLKIVNYFPTYPGRREDFYKKLARFVTSVTSSHITHPSCAAIYWGIMHIFMN